MRGKIKYSIFTAMLLASIGSFACIDYQGVYFKELNRNLRYCIVFSQISCNAFTQDVTGSNDFHGHETYVTDGKTRAYSTGASALSFNSLGQLVEVVEQVNPEDKVRYQYTTTAYLDSSRNITFKTTWKDSQGHSGQQSESTIYRRSSYEACAKEAGIRH